MLLFSILAILSDATSYRKIQRFIAARLPQLNALCGLHWKRAPAHTAIRYTLQGQGFEGGQELSGCGSVGLVAQRQQAGHGYMRSAGIVGPLHGRLLGSTRMLAILSQLDLLGRGD